MTEYISWSGQAAPALENAPMAFWCNFEWTCHKCLMLASSILRMVIVRIPEDHRWVPAYPTSGIAIEFQFLSLFVIVSFLKVRVRARAHEDMCIRGLL